MMSLLLYALIKAIVLTGQYLSLLERGVYSFKPKKEKSVTSEILDITFWNVNSNIAELYDFYGNKIED